MLYLSSLQSVGQARFLSAMVRWAFPATFLVSGENRHCCKVARVVLYAVVYSFSRICIRLIVFLIYLSFSANLHGRLCVFFVCRPSLSLFVQPPLGPDASRLDARLSRAASRWRAAAAASLHHVTSWWRSTRQKMMVFTVLTSIVFPPLFIRFTSDSSDSSCVRFVFTSSTC
jgi:hypothetical protein